MFSLHVSLLTQNSCKSLRITPKSSLGRMNYLNSQIKEKEDALTGKVKKTNKKTPKQKHVLHPCSPFFCSESWGTG